MGYDDNGDAEALVYLLYQLENGACGLGVEGAGGLVAEQNLGIGRERPCDGNALLLAAGELRGVGVSLVGKSDELEKLTGALFGLGLLHARKLEREADVGKAGALHEQVEALEDHRCSSAHLAQLLGGEGTDIPAVYEHRSRGRALEHIDAAHQRALASAAHAYDAEDIAVVYFEVYVPERLNAAVGSGEGFR